MPMPFGPCNIKIQAVDAQGLGVLDDSKNDIVRANTRFGHSGIALPQQTPPVMSQSADPYGFGVLNQNAT